MNYLDTLREILKGFLAENRTRVSAYIAKIVAMIDVLPYQDEPHAAAKVLEMKLEKARARATEIANSVACQAFDFAIETLNNVRKGSLISF